MKKNFVASSSSPSSLGTTSTKIQVTSTSAACTCSLAKAISSECSANSAKSSDIFLLKDKETRKSRGSCFIGYENQKSTIYAVDNMNSYELCGKTLKVSHVQKFKVPKRLDED